MRYALLCNQYADFYIKYLKQNIPHKLVLFISTNESYIKKYNGERGLSNKVISRLFTLKVDLILVIAYGHKISPRLLKLFKNKWFNLHFSVLPRLRGATPIESSLFFNHKTTGITVIQMNEKIDEGLIFMKHSITILDKFHFKDLQDTLLLRSLPLLRNFFSLIDNYNCSLSHSKQLGLPVSSLTKSKVQKNRFLELTSKVNCIATIVKALSERGVYLLLNPNGKMLRIFSVENIYLDKELPFKKEYENYIAIYRHMVYFSFKGGAITFGEIQMSGRKKMNPYQWSIGYQTNKEDYRKCYKVL